MVNGCGIKSDSNGDHLWSRGHVWKLKVKSGDQTEKGCLSRKVLFAVTVTVASHPPRRLDVVEEKSNVVVLLVVSAVAIWGNGPEMIWSNLFVGLFPTRVSVVFPKYV